MGIQDAHKKCIFYSGYICSASLLYGKQDKAMWTKETLTFTVKEGKKKEKEEKEIQRIGKSMYRKKDKGNLK